MSRILDLLVAAALVMALTAPAHAYVSSDGGSMLVQAFVAGFAGVMVVARYLLGRLLERMRFGRGDFR